mgnify:CR=1 FL=1
MRHRKNKSRKTSSEQAEKPAQKAEESFMNIPPEADEEVPFNRAEKEPPKEKEAGTGSIEKRDLPAAGLYSQETPGSDVSKPGIRRGSHGGGLSEGIFPQRTPFQNLPQDFVDGVLIGAWPQVMNVIREMRSKYDIPFND